MNKDVQDMANNTMEILKEEGKYEEFIKKLMAGKNKEAAETVKEVLDRRRSEITGEEDE